MLRAVDLDGDGGDDLVILDGGTDDPIRVRFSAEGGQARPRAAVPRRDAPGDRLRPDRRQAGRRAADDREPVGPGQGPHARRGRRGRAGKARPADLLSAAPGQRARPVARPRRPRRRRQGRRGRDRPGQRPVPRLPPERASGPGDEPELPGPGRRQDRPARRPRRRRQGRGRSSSPSRRSRSAGAGFADGRLTFPTPLPDQRRAGRARRGRPRRRQDPRDRLRRPHEGASGGRRASPSAP